jgi:hypothetical protein
MEAQAPLTTAMLGGELTLTMIDGKRTSTSRRGRRSKSPASAARIASRHSRWSRCLQSAKS